MGIRATAISVLPQCKFCNEPAHYNFRVKEIYKTQINNSCAYGCEKHWRECRAEPGLGLGAGQLLITVKELKKMIAPFTEKIVSYPDYENKESYKSNY